MRQKQRWIPTNLISRAEELAEFIRKAQEKGELYTYPVNPKGSQILVMALAIGLKTIAEDIGFSKSDIQGTEVKESEPKQDNKGKDFLEKLMGGM